MRARAPPAAALRKWRWLKVLGSSTPAPRPTSSRTSAAMTKRIWCQTSSPGRSWRKAGCPETVSSYRIIHGTFSHYGCKLCCTVETRCLLKVHKKIHIYQSFFSVVKILWKLDQTSLVFGCHNNKKNNMSEIYLLFSPRSEVYIHFLLFTSFSFELSDLGQTFVDFHRQSS